MTAFATPFANELCTNYVPTSQDRDHIRDILVEPQIRLGKVDNKIYELEQALEALKKGRKNLDDEIQQHKRLLSPIRRLPDDMLREIFLACLPGTHNAVMDCEEAPLLLGLVCNRWRLLAYSTPSLWASLHIPLPSLRGMPYRSAETAGYYEAYDGRIEKHYTAIHNWLLRSGSCPLSISFHTPLDNLAQLYEAYSQRYLNIILLFSNRWHDLEMSVSVGHLSDRMASIPTTSVPILTHLRLIFSRRISKAECDAWRTNGLLHAPRLRTLDISYIPFPPSFVSGNFWTHLSSLNLTHAFPPAINKSATMEEAFSILSRCPRLINCSLDISDESGMCPTGTISLPFLKSLSISESCDALSTLFECFSDLPEIRGISYLSRLCASYSRTSPLITLLNRTNKQLTYLSMDFSAFTHADLSNIFSLVPKLTHLVHENTRFHSRFPYQLPGGFNVEKVSLDLLSPLSSGEMYCPRLQIFHINKQHQLSDAHLLSFLRTRMSASQAAIGGVEPLREFRTAFSRAKEMDIQAQLLDYIENGPLKLYLTYQSKRMPHYPQFNPRNGLLKGPVLAPVHICQCV
ncbi:hypothetical protein BJ912DRAFT_974993 [Pholiota molesta]|nr:hypothetical protein BJ912DRAFT_974993 [Pholiota molesta]